MLSLFLAIVMIVISCPVVAIAQDEADTTQESVHTATESVETDRYILQEDPSKRGEFEKHYLCSDGTFVVATYAEAVHYQDDSGVWQDVDMRFAADLEASTLEAAPTAQTQNFTLSVPTVSTEGHLMRMEKDGTSFAWTLTAQKADTLTANATVSRAAPPAEQITLQASAQIAPQIEKQKTTTAETQPAAVRKTPGDPDAFALPNASTRSLMTICLGKMPACRWYIPHTTTRMENFKHQWQLYSKQACHGEHGGS